jgi:hypothetical protein
VLFRGTMGGMCEEECGKSCKASVGPVLGSRASDMDKTGMITAEYRTDDNSK